MKVPTAIESLAIELEDLNAKLETAEFEESELSRKGAELRRQTIALENRRIEIGREFAKLTKIGPDDLWGRSS